MGETISKGKGGFEGIGKVVWSDWMELEMQLYCYKQFLKPLFGVVLTVLTSCQSRKVPPTSVTSVRLLIKETVRQKIMVCLFPRSCFNPQLLQKSRSYLTHTRLTCTT